MGAVASVISACAPSTGRMTQVSTASAMATRQQARVAPTPNESGRIQSRIVSSFTGFNYGNVYELANGQVWRQVEPYAWSWYAYYPRVVIYSSNGTDRLQVEWSDRAVAVHRVR